MLRSSIWLAITLLIATSGSAFSQSQPLAFSGRFQAVDLGFDSKWVPGNTDAPDSGNPIQVRVGATGVATADGTFDGSLGLNGQDLTLGAATGEWGYDFGAAIIMKVAINLAFHLNNPLPIGNDIDIGPWVLDIPYAPDFDLTTAKRAQVNSFLLDDSSNLTDTSDAISVYDLSLINLMIGGLNLPDWALAIIGLDAGASLNVSYTTDATLSCDDIAMSDGTDFTSEGQTQQVATHAPSYDANASYNENLIWNLKLNFGPAVFVKILGQRYELPVFMIPWQVLSDKRDMTFNQPSVSFPVAAIPEGEGSGTTEGQAEGTPEPINFFDGCPAACGNNACDLPGFDAYIAAAFDTASVAAPISGNAHPTDVDGNGIADKVHASLLDSLLASPDTSNYCCIRSAWDTNFSAIELMAGFSGDRAITELQAAQLKVLAALATFGEPAGYDAIASISSSLGWHINLHQLDPTAGAWLAAQGDADLDGVCNRGEYDAIGGDLVAFVISATDPSIALETASCVHDCAPAVDGEGSPEGDAPVRWTLSVLKEGTGTGDVILSPDQPDYADGQTVTLSVFLGRNSVLFGWNGVFGIQLQGENGNEVHPIVGTNQYSIVMNGNKIIRPHFYLYAPIEGEPEGTPAEGEVITEGQTTPHSSADLNDDGSIGLDELLRLIQLYNAGTYYCDGTQPDGVSLTPQGEGEVVSHQCTFHTSDYSPADWRIELTELLRLVQIYNLGAYIHCDSTEDGFCAVSR